METPLPLPDDLKTPSRPAGLVPFALIGSLLGLLFLIGTVNPLPAQVIAGSAGFAVAFAIFAIANNTRRLADGFFQILGISFLFISSIDLVHALASGGVGIPGTSANLSAQLGLAARYFQGIAVLVATFFIGRSLTRDRKHDAGIVAGAGTAITLLLFLSIVVWQNFPACWIAGTGPAPFAIAGGYLVPLILAAATGFLYRKREHLEGGVWQQLVAALVFQIPAVLAFTFFDPAAGIVPVLGYLSLLLSAWLFYRVFVLIGLTRPYDQVLHRMQSDEDRLTQGERKYRTLFENMLEGFAYCRMIYDEEGRPSDWVYLDVNKAFGRLTGLENIQGKRVLEAIPDIRALTPELFDTYGRVASSGVPESFEINFLPLKKWLRVSVSSPEKGYFVAVFEDISERKQTDEELRRARDFYLKILDDFPNPVWRADVNAKCDYFNRDWLAFTGRSLAQELGDGWTEGVHPDDLDRCVKIFLDNFHARQPFTMEYRLRYHDGTYHWLLDSGKPFYTPEGAFAGYIGSCYDIQARKQAEEAFRIANSKLNLLSSITRHDINNQLLTLKAYLELSKNSLADPAKTAEYIIKEERAADAIGRQIVFTKEYQDLGVNAPDWQSVEACVQKALAALPLRDVRVGSSVGSLEVYADPLLEKVFYNLIDNALRYGGMKMTMIRIASRETERGLVVTVEDNGSGIAPEDRNRLFERGFGHNTGLGLFLSREILAITGMTIAETGEPGTGARFEIAVPRGAWRVAGGEKAGAP